MLISYCIVQVYICNLALKLLDFWLKRGKKTNKLRFISTVVVWRCRTISTLAHRLDDRLLYLVVNIRSYSHSRLKGECYQLIRGRLGARGFWVY